MLIRYFGVLSSCGFILSDASVAFAQDAIADHTVSYISGTGISPSYTNSSAALGAPSLTATFTAPPLGNPNIIGVELGGELTLAFNLPLFNDPDGNFGAIHYASASGSIRKTPVLAFVAI